MPVNPLPFRRSLFREWKRLGAAWLGVLVTGATFAAAADKPSAPASQGKGTLTTPAANVTKLQAWKDAEMIASLAPGRTEVIGAGDSMKPVYGENTILVISKISFDELKPGMSVVYTNRRGHHVVHQALTREAAGWRVQGINNDRADADRVTRENLLGVVYASLSYSDEKPCAPAEPPVAAAK